MESKAVERQTAIAHRQDDIVAQAEILQMTEQPAGFDLAGGFAGDPIDSQGENIATDRYDRIVFRTTVRRRLQRRGKPDDDRSQTMADSLRHQQGKSRHNRDLGEIKAEDRHLRTIRRR